MFAIIKGSIKDITDRKKQKHKKEEMIQKAVENVEYTNIKTRKKKQTNSIMDILRG